MLSYIFNQLYFCHKNMSNPFEFFANDDQDDTYQNVASDNKPKRTHAEKRVFKQQLDVKQKITSSSGVTTEPLPENIKENAKAIRNPRHPPTTITKQLGEGHFHDKRSGTGRVDKPRKAGGGKGNVGNVKDDMNQDKYIKEGEENIASEEVIAEEPKEVEPEALTLEEYYKNKGVDLQEDFSQKPTKKGEVKAEWIKKEKLTVMETKEDKRQNEQKSQNAVKHLDARGGIDESLGSLGFNSKPSKPQQVEKKQSKPEHKGKGGKAKKVALDEEDFPSL